jgi:hypothetical protein
MGMCNALGVFEWQEEMNLFQYLLK